MSEQLPGWIFKLLILASVFLVSFAHMHRTAFGAVQVKLIAPVSCLPPYYLQASMPYFGIN